MDKYSRFVSLTYMLKQFSEIFNMSINIFFSSQNFILILTENLPRKKCVTLQDQYAVDEYGRRRFHGAFTGGFSAGYFNSVGTRDGWKPQQFKSSRSSKAGGITQRPEDFMDEEDTSEFGIAPRRLQTTEDYTDAKKKGTKRARQINDGPIPGIPVLQTLLRPVR